MPEQHRRRSDPQVFEPNVFDPRLFDPRLSDPRLFAATGLDRLGAGPLRENDPRQAGPYRTVAVLGSGGMGRIYLGRDAQGEHGLVAVKVIRPEYAEDPHFRRRFQREATALARVQGDTTVRLVGTGLDGDLVWMATEYLPGLNLSDAVAEHGPIGAAAAWRLVADLGRAIRTMGAAGVVHRDLKPSNVILAEDGARVIDFGISQATDTSSITTTGQQVGTPAYMSPEQARGAAVTAASDVFSLGSTLAYALAGRAPFGDGTGVDVLHRVAFEPPKNDVLDAVAEADPELAALVAACLEKEPEARPQPERLIEAAGDRRSPAPWPAPVGEAVLARTAACRLVERQIRSYDTVALLRGGGAASDGPGSAAAGAEPPAGPAAPPPPASPFPAAVVAAAAPAPAPEPAATPASARRRKRLLAGAAVLAAAVVIAVVTVLPGSDGSPARADAQGTRTVTSGTRPAPGGSGAGAVPLPQSSGSAAQQSLSAGGEPHPGGGIAPAVSRAPAGATPSAPPSGAAPVTVTSGPSAPGSADPSTTGPSAVGPSSAGPSGPASASASAAQPVWDTECTYYSGTEPTAFGDSGDRVLQVQCILTARGYIIGAGDRKNGRFGKSTGAAVKRFQRGEGLTVDGEVDSATWAALRASG